MFGQPRPPFGAATTRFSTSSSTPNTTPSGFGTSSFVRPAFGNPVITTSFGTSTAPFGSATSSGTSPFGTQPQPQTGGSLFGQPQPSTGFGSTSGESLFSQAQPSTGIGLVGSSATSGFGAQNPTQNRPFGFSATSSASTTGASGVLFGTTQPATGLFSTPRGFGAGATVSGTTIKYDAIIGTDIMFRNGVSRNIRTRIEVITAMKEYENKSLEELRVEDYVANRKGPGQGSALSGFTQTTQPSQQGAGLYGAAPGSLFGTAKQENKSLFGTGTSTGFGTSTTGSLLGTNTPSFSQPTSTATTGFDSATAGSLFGTSSLRFMQPSATSATGFTFGNSSQIPPATISPFGTNLQTFPSTGSILGSSSQTPLFSIASSLQTPVTGLSSSSQTPLSALLTIGSSTQTNSTKGFTFENSVASKNPTNPFFTTGSLLSTKTEDDIKETNFSSGQSTTSTKEVLAPDKQNLPVAILTKIENLTEDKFKELGEKLSENLEHSSEKLHNVYMSKIETLFDEKFREMEDKCHQQVSSVLTSKLEKLFRINFKKLATRASKLNHTCEQHLEAPVKKPDALVTDLDVSCTDKCKESDEKPQVDNARTKGDYQPFDTERLLQKIPDDIIAKLESLFDHNFRIMNERFLDEQDKIARLLSKLETSLEMKMSAQENTAAQQASVASLEEITLRLSRLETLLPEKDKYLGDLKNKADAGKEAEKLSDRILKEEEITTKEN